MRFILLLLIFTSCSEELQYTEIDLWKIAYAKDPSIEVVQVPESQPEKRIICSNYGKGCVVRSGKRIKVRTIDLIVVRFESTELAMKEAKRINQYYARNWVFDDVEGEPVLVNFVEDTFQATNPNHKKKSE